MEDAGPDDPPIACTLDAGDFKERIGLIAELNRAALVAARRDGRRLISTYHRDYADQVREMVCHEKQCCGFLEFDLTDGPGGITLVIEAPQNAAGALDAIFVPFLTAAPSNGGCGCAIPAE